VAILLRLLSKALSQTQSEQSQKEVSTDIDLEEMFRTVRFKGADWFCLTFCNSKSRTLGGNLIFPIGGKLNERCFS
jgi:hypothetical protein